MSIRRFFSRGSPQIVTGSKVLVCSLDSRFSEWSDADRSVYSRYYSRVDAVLFSEIAKLVEALEKGYDIIHLFTSLTPDGRLTDMRGGTLTGSEVILKCCERDVKVLWFASENTTENYIQGVKAAGRPLNLVMTLSRNGTQFSSFLEALLSRITSGEALTVAWASLAPQAEGAWQQALPSCIFSAGRAGVKLLP